MSQEIYDKVYELLRQMENKPDYEREDIFRLIHLCRQPALRFEEIKFPKEHNGKYSNCSDTIASELAANDDGWNSAINACKQAVRKWMEGKA
jgi:hypothetical protein